MYPKSQIVSDIFSWSHICLLMQAEDELERSFYEKECIAQKWDVRTLKRQMNSALYLCLAASKDKGVIYGISCQQISFSQSAIISRGVPRVVFQPLLLGRIYSVGLSDFVQ